MGRAELICDELSRCGIEFVICLADTESRHIFERMVADPRLRVVQVCHEAEAMGICGGLHAAGKNGVILMQNTGFLNSLDALRGIILHHRLPLLMLVTYRGYRGMMEGGKPFDSAPIYTEPALKAMGIKYYFLRQDEDVENVGRAYKEAIESSAPVAVLIA